MGGFVLQIKVDVLQARQVELDQVSVGRPVEIRLDSANRLTNPIPIASVECPVDVEPVFPRYEN